MSHPDSITNIAAYRFAALGDLPLLRAGLQAFCRERLLKGTILLSPEGVNLFVAGTRDAVEALLGRLRQVPGLESLEAKYSLTGEQPFRRMLVRLKREIIAFGVPGIAPAQRTSPKLPAAELKRWLDEGRPVTLLDTRNDYEIRLGTFRNALPIGVDHFRDFPAAVARLPEALKDQPVVMFCTGGIRCEKAGPYMESQGFRHIHQLEGGILKYFEECGSAHYDGECFVFDQRVGVDPALRETGSAQCFRCLTPLTTAEQDDPRYVPGRSCPHCHRTPEEERAQTLARRQAQIRAVTTPLPGSTPVAVLRPLHVPLQHDGLPVVEVFEKIVQHLAPGYWQQECRDGALLDSRHRVVQMTDIARAGERYLHRLPQQSEPDVNADVQLLHEDEALLVLVKPAPLPMHAGGRYTRNTLQQILADVYRPQKPRPAHRLDANTTGVVLVARNRHVAGLLQRQFAAGSVVKRYLVRVEGTPPDEQFECDAPIGTETVAAGARQVDTDQGQSAHTRFRVLRRYADGSSLLEALPLTGRTNQIRIHCAHLGWPVRGDATYRGQGVPAAVPGAALTRALDDPPLCLHASTLEFDHPVSGERLRFEAPAPAWAG